jgi:hypothetical protein
MKLAQRVLGIALVLGCYGAGAAAQTETPAEKPNTTNAEKAPVTYRLTYTITELDGGKHLGTQHFAVTANPDAKDATIRLGSKVPIVTGSTNLASPAQTQVQYLDVGLNIDARLREVGGVILVTSKVEQSNVAEGPSTVGRSDPVIRQATLENTAVLTPGKPVMLGSLDVPDTSRHLDIEVVLEVVR